MDSEKEEAYLFDITKEVKQFYESPVIFLLKKDYSEVIFETMCKMKTAIRDGAKNRIIDMIVDFHLHWLQSVNELEIFRNKLTTYDLKKEDIYDAINYTIDSLSFRLKKYLNYMETHKVGISSDGQANINSDLEIVEEMHKEVTDVLLEKLKKYRNYSIEEHFSKILNEVDDLFVYLDKIHDGLSILLSKYLNMNVPHLSGDLTKTLQQIIDEIQSSNKPTCQKFIQELKTKGKEISSMIRGTAARNLEISKVVEKINVLEERIKRLQQEQGSAALMALVHKKEYLEKRLDSLENLKITIKQMHEMTDVELEDVDEEDLCICEDFFQLRIFNHNLPAEERDHLITELCSLWDLAVFGERSRKSIISILSAADMREEYADELGTFFIDGHSRKIYKFADDDVLYQPNELNELVPLSDDADHVYFYDECGRYFIDPQTRQRIYKAHATASEYMMDSTGVLLKIKEERDGIVYYYDNYGRYYVDQYGKHIYRDVDAVSEYENDGLGNLVRIRSHLDIFQPCPDDANVSDDFKYLKRTVGPALRESIADCILRQPADPINFLSSRLLKYRENLELKEKRAREQEALNVEREIRIAEERAAAERAAMEAALLAQGGSETSYDSNLFKYQHEDGAPSASAAASSK
ncbi:uncharacterized protein LOC106139003 [Amyelois transitella]|uniref:uncharacterized protein LOC106139003 n=1 Tax=Amyelois transitella TaxID=680683 RepID=UPI00067CE583|nr:uncharacterized protein LOC106139003 [Amyelois transitella]